MKCDKKFGCSLKSETALGCGGGANFYNGINTTTRVFTGTDAPRLQHITFLVLTAEMKIKKMTRETPEVRSDKRKPREKKEREKREKGEKRKKNDRGRGKRGEKERKR